MTKTGNDPLLLAAQALLWFFIGVLIFVLIMVGIGLPAAAIFQDQIITEAAAKGITAGPELVGAVLVILAAVFAMLALALYFVVLLQRIIRSVKDGDPFIEDNAERLYRMGWVALASQIVMVPLGAISLWIAEITKDVEDVHIDTDVGISFEGILLTLVLFILARVFRHGAAMREDLKGTV